MAGSSQLVRSPVQERTFGTISGERLSRGQERDVPCLGAVLLRVGPRAVTKHQQDSFFQRNRENVNSAFRVASYFSQQALNDAEGLDCRLVSLCQRDSSLDRRRGVAPNPL